VSTPILRPAPNPCGSCPYRRDVPAGLWALEEYQKLIAYDGETFEQIGSPGIFLCHQQDGRICAGWAATHNMEETLAIRIAAAEDRLTGEELEATLDYTTDVPLFESGREAAIHGMRGILNPDARARREIDKLERKRDRRERESLR
jgi:uncharacterized protein DUF6283